MTGGARVGIGLLMIDKPFFREDPFSGTRGAGDSLDGGHVGLYILVMAEKEVLYCSVLAVSDHGCYRYLGILFVFLDEKAHFTPVVDGSRGHLHRGDHFMEPINRPVRFVPELCPPCMADNGGIRIGGGDESGCSRPF